MHGSGFRFRISNGFTNWFPKYPAEDIATATGEGMGRMEEDKLTNFTLHLESLTRNRDKNIAGTNVRFYPASTLRRDIVMRLRDAVGRSSMREIRAAVFPEKTRLLSSFPGPPKPHKPSRLDSPENTRTGCLLSRALP